MRSDRSFPVAPLRRQRSTITAADLKAASLAGNAGWNGNGFSKTVGGGMAMSPLKNVHSSTKLWKMDEDAEV
jgi:hypothetical protein